MGYCGPRGIPLSTFLSWSQDDQDAALAWQEYEARRDQNCGYHPDEGKVHAHIDVCPGCVERERVQKQAAEIHGSHVRLARGALSACSRCQAEAAANAPRPPVGTDR